MDGGPPLEAYCPKNVAGGNRREGENQGQQDDNGLEGMSVGKVVLMGKVLR